MPARRSARSTRGKVVELVRQDGITSALAPVSTSTRQISWRYPGHCDDPFVEQVDPDRRGKCRSDHRRSARLPPPATAIQELKTRCGTRMPGAVHGATASSGPSWGHDTRPGWARGTARFLSGRTTAPSRAVTDTRVHDHLRAAQQEFIDDRALGSLRDGARKQSRQLHENQFWRRSIFSTTRPGRDPVRLRGGDSPSSR